MPNPKARKQKNNDLDTMPTPKARKQKAPMKPCSILKPESKNSHNPKARKQKDTNQINTITVFGNYLHPTKVWTSLENSFFWL